MLSRAFTLHLGIYGQLQLKSSVHSCPRPVCSNQAREELITVTEYFAPPVRFVNVVFRCSSYSTAPVRAMMYRDARTDTTLGVFNLTLLIVN